MAGEPLPATPAEPGVVGSTADDPAGQISAGSNEPLRSFSHEGETWVVEVAGRGTAGTGRFADPGLQLVRFTRHAAHETAILEVLTAISNIDQVHDQELLEWFRRARTPADPADAEAGRSDKVTLDEADNVMRSDLE